VHSNPFGGGLKKCQDGDHLKFGESFNFFIHTSFGPKKHFPIKIHTLFHPNLALSSIFFYRNEKNLAKKDYFYLVKSGHLF